MRGLLLVLLASCTWSSRGDDADPGDQTIRSDGTCLSDRACSNGELCARTGACLPPSQIRAVHVIWTVRGAAADASTCSPSPDLEVDFRAGGSSDRIGYAPVPCVEGKFTVDKLPTKFDQVRLRHKATWESATIDDASGNAVFDLAL